MVMIIKLQSTAVIVFGAPMIIIIEEIVIIQHLIKHELIGMYDIYIFVSISYTMITGSGFVIIITTALNCSELHLSLYLYGQTIDF